MKKRLVAIVVLYHDVCISTQNMNKSGEKCIISVNRNGIVDGVEILLFGKQSGVKMKLV